MTKTKVTKYATGDIRFNHILLSLLLRKLIIPQSGNNSTGLSLVWCAWGMRLILIPSGDLCVFVIRRSVKTVSLSAEALAVSRTRIWMLKQWLPTFVWPGALFIAKIVVALSRLQAFQSGVGVAINQNTVWKSTSTSRSNRVGSPDRILNVLCRRVWKDRADWQTCQIDRSLSTGCNVGGETRSVLRCGWLFAQSAVASSTLLNWAIAT